VGSILAKWHRERKGLSSLGNDWESSKETAYYGVDRGGGGKRSANSKVDSLHCPADGNLIRKTIHSVLLHR
jgi:hypothetical protein